MAPMALYPPRFERGNCGIGFVAQQQGQASHALLQMALQGLLQMQHRGAVAADAGTGDGAGILTPLPRTLLAREVERLTDQAVDPQSLAVGFFFFQPGTTALCMPLVESACAQYGLRVLAWREPPINPAAIGVRARATQPQILQALVAPTGTAAGTGSEALELAVYRARKAFERTARRLYGAYVPSFSSRTIVYKGLFLAQQLPEFYADLRDPLYAVPLAVFHQRYSTNTMPTWQRAQPFRVLCHNGEINTLQGNINWMKSREPILPDADFNPVIDLDGSDSAMLDNAVELLVRGGRSLPHALTMLVPPAWERIADLPQGVRDFYQYHAGLTEPWDGPAALVFTDGVTVGATLDRNGLRPCRYAVTDDGFVAAASEAGAVPLEADRIITRGRLGPGQMFMVDTARGWLRDDAQIKADFAARQPYGAWLGAHLRRSLTTTSDLPAPALQLSESGLQSLLQKQAAFGYTSEELVTVLRPMTEDGVEAIGSMGDDTPTAVLSDKPRPLYAFFRQRFAEVTNPPIDPLRESLVMSLTVRLGARTNFLVETPEQAQLLELESPFLTDEQLAALKTDPELRPVTLSATFRVADGLLGLEQAVARMCAGAEAALREGSQVLILSDRGVNARYAFVPALLAVSAVHQHLLRVNLRAQADLIVESGEPRETHHFAALLGYGAAAINPYLALDTAADLGKRQTGASVANYMHAAEHGLRKIMSKMGISTLDAYSGAQIFEIVGLQTTVVERFFTGTPAHLEGLDLRGIAEIVLRWHEAAFTPDGQPTLDSPGFYKFKRSGEAHAFSPASVQALRTAVRYPGALNGHWPEAYAAYKKYLALQSDRPPVDVRDLLDLRPVVTPLTSVETVEPAAAILRRFSAGAMSLGALSAEAHSTMAIALNRLGGLSNSGEGGEDPVRYRTESNDRIKQVASARFGVTPDYLVHADELQIKMAQGSKPGEGGQLPGHKVTAEIAAIRHATPGLTLISPPPHHDIYSIEDLAQLIYDLRQINPRAAISVKLVAQSGVGTIAAGVAKAGADAILISGGAGGTGASPLSSIKYAGLPWELGLAEAQAVLVENGLRGRVRLRVDGSLRTGRDVVIAALLGADEFSFGTAALIAEGCLMARACHLNTCPTGIATQKAELRAKFDGQPEHVMAYFRFVAEEVREYLAALGVTTLADLVGHVEYLRQARQERGMDLRRLLTATQVPGPRAYAGEPNPVPFAAPLGERLVTDATVTGSPTYVITNSDRTFGARLAGEWARQAASADGVRRIMEVELTGSAGQSLGAFGLPGLHLTLRGEANDYVGKGLAGGQIVIRLPESATPQLGVPVLAGNTCLYGATGGEVYIAGRAGERFAVRNSGAIAVVDGVGDHGCEYMTGGLVVVVGSVGYNFGAGMTGGLAYIWDAAGQLNRRVNPQLVRVEALTPVDEQALWAWLTRHVALTGSPTTQTALSDWSHISRQFWKVIPKEVGALTPPPLPVVNTMPVQLLSHTSATVDNLAR